MSDSVNKWLEELGLGQYADIFADNDIEWELLSRLNHEALSAIGVKSVGHRLRIIDAAALAPDSSDHKPEGNNGAPSKPPAAGRNQAERRQLTVMFCDLVGSTELSGQLDPEDLREVVRTYQKTAEEVIQRYGGHIAQYLGDGLLVYFGYPVAHEDGAQRAVYAGIGISKAMVELNTRLQSDYSVSLAVRIGVHTGPVVVGEMGGNNRQEHLAMGETPNLAARLEALAQPGTLVISENTRRLLGEVFALGPLGEQTLKGIAAPVKAYVVSGERLAETRFAAGQAQCVAAMVGRDQELALLLDRWLQAKAGEGQMVVLTGEAGIGKSRIARGLVDALAGEEHLRISYQCSPYHTDTALYPAMAQLTLAAGFAVNDSPEVKLDKLEALLYQGSDDIAMAAPLLAAPLGLGAVAEARHGSLDYSPQQRRTRTLEVLLDQLTGLAGNTPVLFVLEDAHWVDPTTLEFIELALDRIGQHRIMMLLTARPTFKNDFGGHPIVTQLALNRLSRESINGIVQWITRGKPVPAELLNAIAAKTDGVPLFVEELTKSILESGVLRESEGAYVVDGRLDNLTIPSSLHDSLMARLDRLHPIKVVAQTAACIGREFDYDLLNSVSPLPDGQLSAALNQLIAAELMFRRGRPLKESYTFKHALVRDAAYESLLKSQRQSVHTALLSSLLAEADTPPEILAHHAELAGRLADATKYWEQAGDQAVERPAFSEASKNFERAALAAVSCGDDSLDQDRKLGLRVKQIRALQYGSGWNNPGTIAAIDKASQLLDEVGETPHRFAILMANHSRYYAGIEFSKALFFAEGMIVEADRTGDPGQQSAAYEKRGTSKSLMGAFDTAEADFEQSFARYIAEHDLLLTGRSGLHMGTALQCQWAHSLLVRGEAQRAWALVNEIEANAEALAHAATMGIAHVYLAILHQLARTKDRHKVTQNAMDVAIEYGLGNLIKMSRILMAIGQHEEGNYVEAIESLERGLGLTPRPDSNRSHTFLFAVYYPTYASSLAGAGRLDEARQVEHEVTSMLEAEPRNWAAAEAFRLLAESNYVHRSEIVPAIEGLQRAMAIAQEQGAKLWELRASVSLAQVWADQGEPNQAIDILGSIFDNFPVGGRDLPDMATAKALLQELA